ASGVDGTRTLIVRALAEPMTGDWVELAGEFYEVVSRDREHGDVWTIVVRVPVAAGGAEPAFSGIGDDDLRVRQYSVTPFATVRFAITARHGEVVERFDGLAIDERHPRYFAKDGIVNGASALIAVAARPAAATAIGIEAMPAAVAAGPRGSDDPPTPAGVRAALEALEYESEPALVCAPDILTFEDEAVQQGLVGALTLHAEKMGRFAIVDAPEFSGELPPTQELVSWRKQTVNSTYAAVYAPHVRILNPVPGATNAVAVVPPSGFVAGVMARTAVFRAPANQPVRNVLGVTRPFLRAHQDALNPSGVNLIRTFPGRGTLVWGARNATDDVQWRYVNVRRLFLMIEHSVEQSTQWAVFEPNTQSTWLAIRVSVENFLEGQRLAGALAGSAPEESYRVRVGLGFTMTEDDVDNGLVITEVSIAPAKPAEFVVFRFSHKRLTD
ncbi:MAG: phage tail sheath family protein, partial [Agromyces sp.]